MRLNRLLSVFAAAALGAATLTAQPSQAQSEPFPNKPIQLVIPFAPGDTDNMLRPFTDKMASFSASLSC